MFNYKNKNLKIIKLLLAHRIPRETTNKYDYFLINNKGQTNLGMITKTNIDMYVCIITYI